MNDGRHPGGLPLSLRSGSGIQMGPFMMPALCGTQRSEINQTRSLPSMSSPWRAGQGYTQRNESLQWSSCWMQVEEETGWDRGGRLSPACEGQGGRSKAVINTATNWGVASVWDYPCCVLYIISNPMLLCTGGAGPILQMRNSMTRPSW